MAGELALLAQTLAALNAGDAGRINAAMGSYLTAHPRSARGHCLLGLWRSASGSAPYGGPDEAQAALWRALELDPGYLPAARAAARLAAAEPPYGGAERLQALIERYRSMEQDPQKVSALEAYCAELRGPQ